MFGVGNSNVASLRIVLDWSKAWAESRQRTRRQSKRREHAQRTPRAARGVSDFFMGACAPHLPRGDDKIFRKEESPRANERDVRLEEGKVEKEGQVKEGRRKLNTERAQGLGRETGEEEKVEKRKGSSGEEG